MSTETNGPGRNSDEAFMRRALDLATATYAMASPNPQVGCVLVRDGVIVSEGAHIYDAKDHAEIVALKQARARGVDPAGTTAYVTLEPCSHHGRTGPCADALVAAGIARCVVATGDPNPLVHGGGIEKLRAAGIPVAVGVLQAEARQLNDAFAHTIQTGRPFVTLKAALSVDGRLAPPLEEREPGRPFWLTGPAAREEVQRIRHASDAILSGIGTVLADDPAMTDRTGLPRRRPLLRVVLDTHLRIPLDSKLVRSAEKDLLVLCADNAPSKKAAQLEAYGVEVVRIPREAGRHSLPAVLDLLAGRKLLSVLLEAGSILNGAFLTQHLVDKAVLMYAETELGPNALPFAAGIPSPFHLQQMLQRVETRQFGPDVCVSGYLHDPWSL
ncbi:bifunctional diaminohydroxyphosphoribosylaminopyrimidine deaminase/5-amino-6-(5-phosphoribosylamino)uracil reductase RibD [Granulicella rosea]|nr:bifunctional diaminohydroxyphosphoribosylaminopyrimidine deaminase/5-amino-6-(5-phosphoribosylamino)uracil reductase RibD [Granulicella rosea]